MASIIKANELQDFGGNSIITSDGAGNVTVNAAAMKNTPAFSAYRVSSVQSISDSTLTTILYNAEQVDTDNCYDTSTGRFTPTTAGKYFVTFSTIGSTINSNADFIFGYIKKNTTIVGYSIIDFRANPGKGATITNSAIVSMNGTTDYLLTQIWITGNFSGSGLQVDVNSNFNAYKIIE